MSLRIIVTGFIGQYPLGGMTWDFLNYVLGFARMGHEVYYIEDSGQWPYNPTEDGKIKNCDFNIDYLGQVMARFGLEERWAFRFGWKDRWFGLADSKRQEVIDSADLLVNVSGTLERPEQYRGAQRMAYIDTDPVFTQLKLARGQEYLHNLIAQHDIQFSFGERVAESMPPTGFEWQPTRQPVVLDEWRTETVPRDVFTTVMTWVAYNSVEFEGQTYGQKDVEFRRFIELPEAVAPIQIELAANTGLGRKMPRDLMLHRGWQIVDPREVCADLDGYRSFVQGSKAEWSVAKNGYVNGRAAWFSCRSACYLAAGRPVVVQDTGFPAVLPTGRGIVSFSNPEEAAEGIRSVQADYAEHAEAARAIAEDCFDSAKVLGALIERASSARC